MNNAIINIMARLVATHFPIEQSGYPSEWEGWKEFIAAAQSEGFTRLGNGYFSAAFSHVSNTEQVLKVGFKKEDSGAAYAAFCRMNQGKVGIPNIYDIQRHERCYTVLMDWLQPFERNYGRDAKLNDKLFSMVSYKIEAGMDSRDDVDWSSYAPTLEACVLIERNRDKLFQTAESIRAFFEGIASFDCHSGNVMVDKAGNLVITDPVSFTQGIKGWDAMEPDVLMSERDAALRMKFQARHDRNITAVRVAERKERRAQKKLRYNQRKARAAELAIKEKDFPMACNMHHHGLIGDRTWHRGGIETLGKLARDLRELDMIRVMCNQPLLIDDLMQARLMG